MDSVRVSQLPPKGERSSVPRLDVRAVLQGCREVILVHRDEEYRLKLTSSGKLILTK
jgi:hemin uptake protein HemP